MPATVDTAAHEVKVEGDDILVRLCEPGELAGQRRQPATAAKTACAAPASRRPDRRRHEPACRRSRPKSPRQPLASGELSEDLVREELKKVIDPELFVNIVDLGLIYNVDLFRADEGKTNCKIDMTMTSPMCPAGPQLIANSKQVLGAACRRGRRRSQDRPRPALDARQDDRKTPATSWGSSNADIACYRTTNSRGEASISSSHAQDLWRSETR